MDRIPVLVVTEGPLANQRFPLVEGEGNTIGRGEQCDITIPDEDVSRQHASILIRNGGVWVQDDNSRNGVFVNGKRVVRRPVELKPGGKVSIGIHVFVLELEENHDVSVVRSVKDLPKPEGNHQTILIAIAAVLIVGIAIYFLQ